MRALAAVIVLAAACGDDLGGGGEWTSAAAMVGELAPEVEGWRVAGAPRGDHIRVVTYNVHFGADPSRLAAALLDSDDLPRADVFLIQEIESYPGEGASRAAELADGLDMNHAYAPARAEGEGTHGLAILSRFPIDDVEVMQLPRAETRIRPRERIAMRASLRVGDTALSVVNVHLDVRLGLAERIEQMHPVTETSAERVVIGGDFNTNPYAWAGPVPLLPDQSAADLDQSEAFDEYMRAFGFTTPTASSGPTQDAVAAQLRLDSIFVRALQTGDSGVERGVEASDHLPLWLDVAWRP